MNVKQDTQVIVTDSEVIERIMALSDKNLWGFKILGQMEPIKEPVFFDGFRKLCFRFLFKYSECHFHSCRNMLDFSSED